MAKYTDILLYKTHQHYMIYVSRFLRWFLPWVVLILLMWRYVFVDSVFIVHILVIIVLTALLYMYENHLWKNSYIVVTNEKLAQKTRRGFFTKNKMTINYDSIRDIELEKNNIFHFFSGCGTLYARSSSGSQSDFKATWTPNISELYEKVNFLNNLSEEDRKQITSYEQLMNAIDDTKQENKVIIDENKLDSENEKKELSQMETITKEAKTLKNKEGIHEIILLTDEDRLEIFEQEEEKNHWVHWVLKKDVVYAIIHDESFSVEDQNEVIRIWDKEVYPTLEFNDLDSDKAIAGYPGIQVQTYLSGRFVKTIKTDKILLIWFDM